MEIRIHSQYSGQHQIAQVIREILTDPQHQAHNVRFLMAYAKWSGLSLIEEALTEHHDSGHGLQFILGIDQPATSAEALSYLLETFPEAEIHVFGVREPHVTFHPKLVLVDREDQLIALVGSSNLTGGGLALNFELVLELRLERDRQPDRPIIEQLEDVWASYQSPRGSVQPESLRPVTMELIESLADRLSTEPTIAPVGQPKDLFPPASVPDIERRTRPSPVARRAQGIPARRTPTGAVLYLQVLRETGPAGAQVQIPVRVLTEYFAIGRNDVAYLTLGFPSQPGHRRRVLHFANNTHRVQINEVVNEPRPLILEFRPVDGAVDTYNVRIIRRGSPRYRQAMRQYCIESTRSGAKRWGLRTATS